LAENKQQINKRENIAKLQASLKNGTFENLLAAVRGMNSDVRKIHGKISEIEEQQAERVRQEDAAYEQEKLLAQQGAKTAMPEEAPVVAVPEKVEVQEVQPEAVPEVKIEEKPQEVSAPKSVEVAPAKVEKKVVENAPEKVAVVEKPAAKTATTARPSFLSPNQRPRIDIRPPERKSTGANATAVRRPGAQTQGQKPQRQAPTGGAKPGVPKLPKAGVGAVAFVPPVDNKRTHDKKDHNRSEDKKTMSKRTLIRKGFVTDTYGEDRMGSKKIKTKKKNAGAQQVNKVTHAVITTENLTVKALSEQIGVPAQVIIKELMNIGQMVTINSVVDFESMALISIDLGVELELKLDQTSEEKMIQLYDEDVEQEELVERPPIVTVMGHVDHGKTSLLDALRKTTVAAGEAGGITQHIGAYTVTLNGRKITFVDTPGHEAFTAMRARGAQVTDVAIIVVAADDGIMPQTIEAINHAKAADVPIVIACNKIDKQGINIDRVKQQLTEHDIVCEEWGGDSPFVPVSAKTGQGLDALLESVLLIADIKELKANPKAMAKGSIIEARLDKGKGPVASVIVMNGTLRVGDNVVSGTSYGHIRAMTDEKGRLVKEAGPSMAVSVLGFQDVPEAGTLMYAVKDEKLAKQVAAERAAKIQSERIASQGQMSLDTLFDKINEGQLKELNLIIKADVQGSVEALKDSLMKLSNDEVKVKCIHSAVGAINKSDVMLAETSNAIIIGFNVRADNETKLAAEQSKIDIRLYRIIYECIEDVEAAIKGMLAPKFREQILGHAEVRTIFNITGAGKIAGCYVTSGKITRNAKLRIIRDNVVLGEGNVDSLKRFKDDVKEVASNYECGISIESITDYKEGDIIEAFVLEQI